MGYRLRLIDDEDFYRETRAHQEQQDAHDADDVDRDRREQERYAGLAVRLPLLPKAGT